MADSKFGRRALIGDGLSPDLIDMQKVVDEHGTEVAEDYLATINDFLRSMSDADYKKLMEDVLGSGGGISASVTANKAANTKTSAAQAAQPKRSTSGKK